MSKKFLKNIQNLKNLSIIVKDANKPAFNDIVEKYKNYRYDSIVAIEDIPYDSAIKILIYAEELPGITIHRGSKRLYVARDIDNRNTSTTSEVLSTDEVALI